MIRPFIPLGCVLLIAACAAPSTESSTTTQDSSAAQVVVPRIDEDWPGYYTGAFPIAGGKRMQVDLWVRSDSTFIVQQLREGTDSLREGFIGQWHVVRSEEAPATDLLSIQYGGDPPDHYLRTAQGLVFVDRIGGYDVTEDWKLERLADEIGDAIPRMRLSGTFTYMADAQSIQPCGSKFTWPCVGGMDMGEEEGEPLVKFNNADLQKAYLSAVKTGGEPWVIEAICTMGMGPAMEGDGADEYVYIEEVARTLERCP